MRESAMSSPSVLSSGVKRVAVGEDESVLSELRGCVAEVLCPVVGAGSISDPVVEMLRAELPLRSRWWDGRPVEGRNELVSSPMGAALSRRPPRSDSLLFARIRVPSALAVPTS